MPNYNQQLPVPGMNAPRGGLSDIYRNSFFQYSILFTLTASQTLQLTIPIQADADFFCVMSMYDTSLLGGAGATSNLATGIANGGSLVQIIDTSAQRYLQNIPVPASSLFGNAQRPYVWPFTHTFRANGAIGVNAQDTSGAGQTVRYTFAGYKIPLGTGV